MLFICHEERVRARQNASYFTDPAWGQRLPHFIAYSPLMDLTTGPAALQDETAGIYSEVCIIIVQPSGKFFLRVNIYRLCCVTPDFQEQANLIFTVHYS